MENNKMTKVASIFRCDGKCDKKHKLNTSAKAVPVELLEQVEAGCSIETLEKIAGKNFDIFKYGTQITIHGIFPNANTRRIGGRYVNLIQNKNKSVGVKYTAIDHDKKERLFDMLNSLGLFYIAENSMNYYIYKMKQIKNESEVGIVSSEFRELSEKINKDLFFGNVDCFISRDPFYRTFAVLVVNINCFYERDFERIFENLSGMSYSDGCKKIEAIKIEAQRKRAESDAKWKKEVAERNAKEAKNEKDYADKNPLKGFDVCSDYTAKDGDIIATVRTHWGGDPYWDIRKISKSFGRLVATPCDMNGNKIGKKGTEAMKRYGKVWVKNVA